MAITIQGTPATAQATSIAIPTHAAGDVIVIVAYGGTITIPSIPAAGGTVPTYVSITTTSGNANSMRVAYAIAAGTNDTSGTWTNTSRIGVIVLQGVAATIFGGTGQTNGTTSFAVPAVTMTATDGSSMLLGFIGETSATSPWSAAPAGYTQQAQAIVTGTNGLCMDSKDVTTSDGSYTQSAAGAATATAAIQVEFLASSAAAGLSGRFAAIPFIPSGRNL